MATALEDLLMTRVETLTGFQYLPSLNEVMELIDDERADLDRITVLLGEDSQLAEQIVRITSRQTQRSIADARQAVRMVGLNTIRTFLQAIAESEDRTAGGDASAFKLMQGKLWTHAQLVAICCQLIAREVGLANLTQVYTAGLFHDLGTAVLNAFAFEEISAAINLTHSNAMDLVTAEDMALGFNHGYFSAKIIEKWGLPKAIVEAVRFHHAPSRATHSPLLTKILHLADVAVDCQQTRVPIGISLFPVDRQVLADFPLGKERLAELAEQAADLLLRSKKKTNA